MTIVVPIDLSRRSDQIFQRAIKLATKIDNMGLRAIFSINFKRNNLNAKLVHSLSSLQNIIVVKCEGENIPLAKIRNVAINAVNTPYILFLDVDTVFDATTIDYVTNQIANSNDQVVMLPCIYLSAKGSSLMAKSWSLGQAVDDFFNFRRDLVLHLAFPSSLICVDTASVKNINGFDENFEGYGYEDFDFMIRLLISKQLMHLTDDILIDKTYISPLLMEGLRAQIAKPLVKDLISKKYTAHLYHKKEHNDTYYAHHEKNAKYFYDKWKSLLETNVSKPNEQKSQQSFLSHFLDFCANSKINIDDYCALFDAAPKYMWRNYTLMDYFKSKSKLIMRKIHA
jgi:predicted glycosyltransferase involved in capsule biosynthesis